MLRLVFSSLKAITDISSVKLLCSKTLRFQHSHIGVEVRYYLINLVSCSTIRNVRITFLYNSCCGVFHIPYTRLLDKVVVRVVSRKSRKGLFNSIIASVLDSSVA